MSEQVSEMSKNSPEVENDFKNQTSEMQESLWAVISFDRIIADNLTYDAATEIMRQSLTQKIAGLCIVAGEAAARMQQNRK